MVWCGGVGWDVDTNLLKQQNDEMMIGFAIQEAKERSMNIKTQKRLKERRYGVPLVALTGRSM
mgnify:CR=1 FL=1